jgi:ssDNA-binding Zn-finger/Zn-ribbon topoisomerase 1
MKFALIDNTRITAKKGAKGVCPSCGAELVVKCGDFKVHHWSHKGNRNCDAWWENETEWHRKWKGNFTNEWQEVILTDELSGEKHIADIKTEHGLVIEFQHSHISPLERTSRECFYKRMIWIIDGSRLKRDFPRFLKGKENFRLTNKQGIFLVHFPEECFPANWIGSPVPVIFDFKNCTEIPDPENWRNQLYYLFPNSTSGNAAVAIISRESLINDIISGKFLGHSTEPNKQIEEPAKITIPNRPQRQSPYVLHRGKFVKRRRF